MIRLALFFVAASLLAPTSAVANCADYWFTRNLIFDRAGYCFGSPLGQAIFDNGDCTTKSPVLAAQDKAAVARLRANEADSQCQMNTQARSLPLPDIAFRKQLQTIPIPLPRNSAAGCLTWSGGDAMIHNGASDGFAIVGRITNGANIYFNYELAGNWSYVAVESGGGLFQGWASLPRVDPSVCAQLIP
jgi:hypothetical protein